MRRAILFGVSIASLLLLTYAGVLLAFSVPITDEMAAANPDMPRDARAVVVPIAAPLEVRTRATGDEGALIMMGHAHGTFPTAASGVRIGHALAYVPEGSNGTLEVDNLTLDLAALSGGQEGWIAMGDAETEPWFSPASGTLGRVERFETPAKLGSLFAGGALGFVTPLVLVIVTHRGSRRGNGPATPGIMVCRECRSPLAADAEFCMRCGAYTKGDAAHA